MAKRAKKPEQGHGSNKLNPELVADLNNRLDDIEERIASERGKFMKVCRDLREDISGIFTEAKSRGVSVKALKAVRKARAMYVKAAAMMDELETDDLETAEQIADALGPFAELPLGRSAVERAAAPGDAAALRGLQ